MKKFLCLIIAALLFVQPCMAAEEEPVLSGEAQEKVTDLLDLLAAVDAGGNGMYFSENKEIDQDFLDRFLTWSVWLSVPFIEGAAPEITELSDGTSGWKIPEDKLKAYMQNSVGNSDYEMNGNMRLTDGNVEIGGFTPTAVYGHEKPEISKVSRVSETDILAEGTVQYAPEFSQEPPYTASFSVQLTQNAESIWGGYALKEIQRWEKEGQTENTAGAGYTDEELCRMARTYCEVRNGGISPQYVVVDNTDGNMVMIHLYEDMGDHTATFDWYTVDRNTAAGTNTLGETVDLKNP